MGNLFSDLDDLAMLALMVVIGVGAYELYKLLISVATNTASNAGTIASGFGTTAGTLAVDQSGNVQSALQSAYDDTSNYVSGPVDAITGTSGAWDPLASTETFVTQFPADMFTAGENIIATAYNDTVAGVSATWSKLKPLL